jgi:hypothetical protein
MRPQQQNRRMRGRNNNNNSNNNNNNRRGPNPLTRSYESNGPDVKIRGSAQQIAEKYTTLARDAQSSGDRVMAENYLQHAEHYNRIIAAAQAQMPIQNFQQPRGDLDDDLDEDGEDFAPQQNGAQPHTNGGQQPAQQMLVDNGAGPQPVIEGTPAEVALNSDARVESGDGEDGQPRINGGGGQQANAEGEEGGFRRNRRPRRSRNRRGDGENAESGGDQESAAGGNAVAASEAPAGEAPASDSPAFEPVEN